MMLVSGCYDDDDDDRLPRYRGDEINEFRIISAQFVGNHRTDLISRRDTGELVKLDREHDV